MSKMAAFQWRRFNFFDVHKDNDNEDDDNNNKQSLSRALATMETEATCGVTLSGRVYVGCSNGHLIHVDPHQNQLTSSTELYQEAVLALKVHKQRYLVAVGKEKKSNDHVVKVLDTLRKESRPSLIRELRVTLGEPLAALALHPNGQLMALGFESGHLWINRGDIVKQQQISYVKNANNTNNPSNNRIISLNKRIVGLEFDCSEGERLFVATTQEIFVHDLLREQRTVLDHQGCMPGMTLSPGLSDSQLVVGRPEGVSFYSCEGKTHYYALNGPKKALSWFNSYLVIIGSQNGKENSQDMGRKSDAEVVTIYDVQNKFLALTLPLSSPVDLIIDCNQDYVSQFVLVTKDKGMIRLVEKTLDAKLDVLFKKNFYDLAIRIAERHHKASSSQLAPIFQRYAEHLYSKGDYSSSISNYCRTIGFLQPSFVVKKFLDAHKIVFLTEYLQALHNAGHANEDHITLLLNCYVKLKDSKRIDEFVFNNQDAVADLDVEIAIKVCRQAGYIDQAIELARKRHCFDLYLTLQMEEKYNVSDSLNYICNELNFVEAKKAIRKYGVALMKEKPEETTEFLKRLCSDFRFKAEDDNLKNEPITTNATISTTAASSEADRDENENNNGLMAAEPEDYLHLFVHHSSQMVDFLEHMLAIKPNLSKNSQVLVNTLLEHHLHQWSVSDDQQQLEMEKKIMSILGHRPRHYDGDHALMLCQTHNFVSGLLFLLEERELYTQIVRFHVTHQNGQAVLKTCRKFGPSEPQLWVKTLQMLAEEGEEQLLNFTLDEVLSAVEQGRLLSSSNVVRILGKSSHTTLGMIRAYLDRVLRAEDKQLEQNRRISDQYSDETRVLREKLMRLRTEAVVFQATKCTACKESLELPSVHFLCLHSFHRHCFIGYSESGRECPECAKSNAHIKSAINAADTNGVNDELFHQRLADAQDDPMAVVADFLGRGVFSNTNKANNEYIPENAYNPFEEDSVSLEETSIDANVAMAPVSKSEESTTITTPTPSTRSLMLDKAASLKSMDQLSSSFDRRQPTLPVDDRLSLRSNLTQGETVSKHKESDGEDLNPFGDVGDDDDDKDDGNPFREELKASNPFGDPDDEDDDDGDGDHDYDNQLNPFGSN